MSDTDKTRDDPDENKLIAERRAKLAALREQAKAAGMPAFPNDFRRDVLAVAAAGRVRRASRPSGSTPTRCACTSPAA